MMPVKGMLNIVGRYLFSKIFAVVLLLLLLIFLLFFSLKDVSVNNKAVKHFNSGNFEIASNSLNKEIEKQPNNCAILNNAAGAEYKLNKFDEAQEKYTMVLNSPNASDEVKFAAFYALGNIAYLKGDFQKAIGLYKEALKLNHKDKDAKFNLELTLLKLKEKGNKQNEQENKEKDLRQEEQNLKKQMEQNDKAIKENEERQRLNNQQENSGATKQDKDQKEQTQKELDEEKEQLNQEKLEISEKIRNLQASKPPKNDATVAQKPIQNDALKAQQQEKKDEPAKTILSYFDEEDSNRSRLKRRNEEPLKQQQSKDW
ncbi:MAG: tetratricopeptide repeat protein [Endomicrobium sp.]|jgi:tetratricopeptide (TPR) repeat protein|nr:tetratricopeptide repeat protein [Endomicrobium sp.]